MIVIKIPYLLLVRQLVVETVHQILPGNLLEEGLQRFLFDVNVHAAVVRTRLHRRQSVPIPGIGRIRN